MNAPAPILTAPAVVLPLLWRDEFFRGPDLWLSRWGERPAWSGSDVVLQHRGGAYRGFPDTDSAARFLRLLRLELVAGWPDDPREYHTTRLRGMFVERLHSDPSTVPTAGGPEALSPVPVPFYANGQLKRGALTYDRAGVAILHKARGHSPRWPDWPAAYRPSLTF